MVAPPREVIKDMPKSSLEASAYSVMDKIQSGQGEPEQERTAFFLPFSGRELTCWTPSQIPVRSAAFAIGFDTGRRT